MVRYYVDAVAGDPDALRGGFAAYRALDATIARNERRKERRLTLPVLGIGGAQGIGEGAANTMKLAADDVQSVVIPGCGHYCLEEATEEVVAALTAFLPRTGKASDMGVVVVTAFPVPEHRAEVIAAFETAIARVHGEPGVELYTPHEGRDRLVMMEKYESERARTEHAKGAAWQACGRLWKASSAAVSTRRSASRTRLETRRRVRCDRSP